MKQNIVSRINHIYAKVIQWGKNGLFNSLYRSNWILIWGKSNLDPYIILHTKLTQNGSKSLYKNANYVIS